MDIGRPHSAFVLHKHSIGLRTHTSFVDVLCLLVDILSLFVKKRRQSPTTPGASGGIRWGIWQKKLKRPVCHEKWVLPVGASGLPMLPGLLHMNWFRFPIPAGTTWGMEQSNSSEAGGVAFRYGNPYGREPNAANQNPWTIISLCFLDILWGYSQIYVDACINALSINRCTIY